MLNRSTIEFFGLWEKIKNPNFNSTEFDAFKNEAPRFSAAMRCGSCSQISFVQINLDRY
jgi:hypothetical protein